MRRPLAVLMAHAMISSMNADCDFLIVGGGVGGTSAGAFLSQHGSVVVLEAESALAYHASGRSAALFEENYGQPSTIALNCASRSYHENNDLLSQRGILLVGTPQTAGLFDHDLKAMQLEPLSARLDANHQPQGRGSRGL